jgi:glycosyltransferase involved in cell wall biosynthesis
LNLQAPNFLELRVYDESIVIERCAIIKVNNNFEVIHLSTSHKGGAGIAARRLNSELNSVGVKSSFYAIGKQDFTLGLNEYSIKRNFYRQVQAYLSTLVSKMTINVTFFSIFSSSSFSLKWLRTRVKTENTVIHIHNWFNLISLRQLRKIVELGIPVVITLHDQRLATGGCHYSLDCRKFQSGCNNCPKVNHLLRFKVHQNSRDLHKLFANTYQNIKLTAPSNFMVSEASKSSILSSQKVIFLPNSIPKHMNPNKAENKIESRNTFRIGVASANPYDPIKGGDLIYELEQFLEKNSTDIEIVYLANFPKEKYLDFWNSLNCLLAPSRADNSPNVIHEAKQFGLPVIATSVGGITEMLIPDIDISIDLSKLSLESILLAITTIKNKNKLHYIKQIDLIQQSYFEYVSEPLKKTISIYQDLLATK